MITVHREDPTFNLAEIYFNKIKPRSNGNIGKIEIWFDKERLSYFEQELTAPNVYQKIFAAPQKDEPKILTNLAHKLKLMQ
jgi:hypothetical protein